MAQQQQDPVVLNMADMNINQNEPASPAAPKKKQDTLFGPNIGIVARGPEWTESREKVIDELTPEIVKTWIAKSKQANQSTTTLQALVNLKRPSLRLTPLEIAPSDDPEHVDSQHHHGLEFEYDCDAAKCAVSVYVLVSPSHHLADKASGSAHSQILVFETITEGGFAKTLTLDEGATLELGRFEHRPTSVQDPKNEKEAATSSVVPATEGSSPVPAEETAGSDAHRKKRFTAFHFRKRSTHGRAVAGPALAVVDAEAKEDKAGEKDDSENAGVKAIIKLSALDDNGKPLPCVNEQTTYLHIVRFGAQHLADEHDKRPWVVKVVKREATIGAHTFHLHEIYGLSSATSSANSAPPPLPTTYPPTAAPGTTHEDEPSSECLLCLSAPREVVLLPCRHLVACRECAINMIEFGAGGQIVHASEADATTTGAEGEAPAPGDSTVESPVEGGAGGPSAAAAAPSIPTVQPTTNTRRKRKAKGWFCPVCRQPYTSCLRITTTPPSKDFTGDEPQDSIDIADHPLGSASPPAAVAPAATRSGFASLVRPGFLRSASRPQVPDLERGTAAVPATAA